MKSMTMASLIDPARVIPCLRTRDLQHTLGEMTLIAAEAALLDHNATRDAITARGESSSFAVGRGVMIPHAMIAGLEKPLGVFARLDPGLDLDATDGVPVDLAVLILCGEGDEATLLRALACAARRLQDREIAARLRSADSAEALHVMLTSDTWRECADPVGVETPQGNDLTNAAKWPTITVSC
jgi:PTS system nitrogen regulatory IIA component